MVFFIVHSILHVIAKADKVVDMPGQRNNKTLSPNLDCTFPDAFTASTTEVIEFKETVTYQNNTGGITFTKGVKDNMWRYLDRNAGRLYISLRPEYCTVTDVGSGQLSIYDALKAADYLFDVGSKLRVFGYSDGKLRFKVIMDSTTCTPVLLKASFGDYLSILNINYNFNTQNPDLSAIEEIQPALKNCIKVAS
ncbi:hypothetical protein PoB_001912600 [Plakobranchus ocellatus]|uniref:Uncharacterized protein n=1 Tax=Plakobranchus ocellatus TaxID=259542 RepID=A0AAV3ZDA0_9GAST|nr:hypothetical protein PoB_001912600 [Plakobranchus ocellatus]